MAHPSTKPLHFVLVPYPAQGHINPFMQLAKQLTFLGSSITFVNTEHNHLRIVSSQSSHSLPTSSITLVHIPDGLPVDYNRATDWSVLSRSIDEHMPAPFEALVLDLIHGSDNPSVCIVSDILMLFTQDVANKLGLPRIAVWLQSAGSFAVNLYTPNLVQEGFIPITEKSRKELITCIPGYPPLLLPEDLPSLFQTPEDLSNYMFQFKLRPFERLQESKFILINTFHELEKDILLALQEKYRVLSAGPFLPPALLTIAESQDDRAGTGLWPEDNGCLSWLDTQDASSVLYISFGSIASLSEAQFQELAFGLQASGKPLLWAIRPDVKDLISSCLPPNFLSRGHVHVTSWVPQALVLSHKSVGGFLTHCGWNSTLESICMGVPTLCWPYFSDQMMNRKWMVDEWKIGKSFQVANDGMVKKEEVERLVRLVMEEEGKDMRARAQALSCLAKQAVQPFGSSYVNLHQVFEAVIAINESN